MNARRSHLVRHALALCALLVACDARETVRVEIAGERFELELAIDPEERFVGLGGRHSLPRDGGMLFVFARPRPLAVVMRDCPIPLDVAFLDSEGRVVAVHEMEPEPPRRPDETPFAYESRLPEYGSRLPARFILETAGGRLAELGLLPGQRVAFDAEALLRRARP